MHLMISMQRRSNAQKNLEPVAEAISVIAIEVIRPNIDRELSAQSDVDLVSVGKISHVADGCRVNRKDFCVIDFIEHELVSGFLDAFPARVNRVTSALII